MDDLTRKQEFEKIAFQHLNSLYSTALRMTRRPVEAEELIQDTYLRAFKHFDKFELGTNFNAWIFRILTNTFINKYRKQSKMPVHIDIEKVAPVLEDAATGDQIGLQKNYDDSNYREIFDDEIIDALHTLPDDFRLVVILADIEGFSYKEIAKIVRAPVGTVMSRLFRSRQLLKKRLVDYAYNGRYIDKKLFKEIKAA